MATVEFLNVTLNLKEDKYHIFRKPNNEIRYVHKESNHPPCVTKNIPIGINKMLNELSSNEEVFNQTVKDYNRALKECGYKEECKNFEKLIKKIVRKIREKGKFYGLTPHGTVKLKQI